MNSVHCCRWFLPATNVLVEEWSTFLVDPDFLWLTAALSVSRLSCSLDYQPRQKELSVCYIWQNLQNYQSRDDAETGKGGWKADMTVFASGFEKMPFRNVCCPEEGLCSVALRLVPLPLCCSHITAVGDIRSQYLPLSCTHFFLIKNTLVL